LIVVTINYLPILIFNSLMFLSVVIPTYNRRKILEKCLTALEHQHFSANSPIADYEVILVDDGSTDDTLEWLAAQGDRLPHLRLYQQQHQGPAAARNLGVTQAKGDTIVFIDSDLVVTAGFLEAHAQALQQGQQQHRRVFTYGTVIETNNYDDPTSEPYKLTDFSAAYFATGNVAIARHWLEEAGLFDPQFHLYGWEDLELGVRLKKMGLKLIKCPAAAGYHWHPPFTLDRLPSAIDREIQRGRMGVLFYQKHPTWEVRLMIQMTGLHRLLWGILSLGGRLNERTMAPLLQWLIDRGKPQLALELSRIFLNWYNVQGVYAAYREMMQVIPKV
jgi:glycosyltransferase involved in cell wall biosynthesis